MDEGDGMLGSAVELLGEMSISYQGSERVGLLDFEGLAKLEARLRKQTGRNDPCYCGSGVKYKKCCMRQENRERLLNRRLQESLDEFAAFCEEDGPSEDGPA